MGGVCRGPACIANSAHQPHKGIIEGRDGYGCVCGCACVLIKFYSIYYSYVLLLLLRSVGALEVRRAPHQVSRWNRNFPPSTNPFWQKSFLRSALRLAIFLFPAGSPQFGLPARRQETAPDITHRLQLFPRALHVLLRFAAIVEVLSGDTRQRKRYWRRGTATRTLICRTAAAVFARRVTTAIAPLPFSQVSREVLERCRGSSPTPGRSPHARDVRGREKGQRRPKPHPNSPTNRLC